MKYQDRKYQEATKRTGRRMGAFHTHVRRTQVLLNQEERVKLRLRGDSCSGRVCARDKVSACASLRKNDHDRSFYILQ